MDAFHRLTKDDYSKKISALKGNQNIIIDGADAFTANGYIQYPKFIFFDRRLSDVDRTCYALVVHFAFNKDRQWPGQTKLASMWGVHRNTVGSALQRLEEYGFLSVIKQGGRRNDIIILFYTIADLMSSDSNIPKPTDFDPSALGFNITSPSDADLRTRYGWIEIPAVVYEYQGINDADRTLYALLLNYAQGKETCYPSQETLAKTLGKHRRTIEDSIRNLKRAGFLVAERSDGRLNNIYTLNVRVKKQKHLE